MARCRLSRSFSISGIERSLWLIRHGHAKSDQPFSRDFERPLNERGLEDLGRTAAWLAGLALPKVTWLWSSSAARTQATAQGLATAWRCEPVALDQLYLASRTTLLDTLQSTPPDIQHAALVGHNPGISDLATLLGGHAVEFPTLGLLRLSVQGDWCDLRPEGCTILCQMIPKTLP